MMFPGGVHAHSKMQEGNDTISISLQYKEKQPVHFNGAIFPLIMKLEL